MSIKTIASYSCTALVGTNKAGILKPDTDGYYTMVVGAVNSFNSMGAYYPEGPAKELFNESSAFQRRVRDGALFGELGHPRQAPGMNMREFMARCMDIQETNICCHFRKVWLEAGHQDPQGRPIVAIMAEVKPAGAKGYVLKEALENKSENVCFSIRSFTHDVMQNGVLNKLLRTIVTFDKVTEPGISVAKRWYAPGLESHANIELYNEVEILPIELNEVIEFKKAVGCGFESSLAIANEVKQALNWDQVEYEPSQRPASSRW